MNVGLVQKTDNEIVFEHNKKVLPGLIQISSLDEIDENWEFFFYLEDNEIVADKYQAGKLIRIDHAIEDFFKLSNDLKKDIVYIPVSTVNYTPFPPKLLDFKMKPKIFRTSTFTPERLNESINKSDKKTFYHMVLFNVFVQVQSNVEIGKQTYGTMPKLLN